jgi:hypothetical protein
MSWTESHSTWFSARHESSEVDGAAEVLGELERFRAELVGHFELPADEIAVVLHPRPYALALAHPWLPLARQAAAPASRRYFAGWFGEREVHVLSPPALERRASRSEGSREALLLSPLHEYAHVVLGANNDALPPPFSPASFRRYLRWAWLCEGAAAHFSGQTAYLRAAIVRRLREEGRPQFPPTPRDAHLLGGTIFALLEQEAGPQAAAQLATSRLEQGPRVLLHEAFERPAAAVERDWRDYLASFGAA